MHCLCPIAKGNKQMQITLADDTNVLALPNLIHDQFNRRSFRSTYQGESELPGQRELPHMNAPLTHPNGKAL